MPDSTNSWCGTTGFEESKLEASSQRANHSGFNGRLARDRQFESRALLPGWRRRWYGPTTPARRGWLGDRSTAHNTLKARREKSIRVSDHRRSVLNRVPKGAVRVGHPVAIGERDLRPHAAPGAIAGLHVRHVRAGRSGPIMHQIVP